MPYSLAGMRTKCYMSWTPLLHHALLPAGTLLLLSAILLYATRESRAIRKALRLTTRHLLRINPHAAIESLEAHPGASAITVNILAVVAANATTLEIRSVKASVAHGKIIAWDETATPGLSKTEWQGLLRANSGDWDGLFHN